MPGCQDHGYLHELDANAKHPPCPDCGGTGYEFSPCKTCYGCGAVHQPVGPADTDIRSD